MDDHVETDPESRQNALHPTPSQWQPNEDLDLEFKPMAETDAPPPKRG